MAENGRRVLVLEKETVFQDRVRGENLIPWGGAEAERLGCFDLLRDTCAFQKRRMLAGNILPPSLCKRTLCFPLSAPASKIATVIMCTAPSFRVRVARYVC
jgi:hypothetical protein